jgi:dihydrofolate synthase/folylpolyglutamate synthase
MQNNYTQTLEYLYARLPVFQHIGGAAYKPGLDNTIRLLNALNNPQNTYKTIHIAGTNGKGSVSHILAAVLQEAGYKVGLYTSPHLVDFGERIRVNGEKIAQNYVVDFVAERKTLFDEVQPSFFEATMAMAFAYFADEKVDVAVIETGMGGRLDSTNILRPELSVITNISFDHMDFLGNTLTKIAGEKAGIIKQNTPIVIGEAVPESRAVFLQKASEMNAPITFSEEKLQIISSHYENDKLHFTTSENKSYALGLTGNYQLKNAITSLVSIELMQKIGFHISEKNIETGFANVVEITNLQGRWQKVGENPKIVLDTGHNLAGMENVVRQLREQKYKTLRIVIGMANDKDISAVLALLPKNAVYYFTQANTKRALPALELQKQAISAGLNGKSFTSVKSAIETAISDADADDFIFIGGSNFVVGEAILEFRN